MKVGERGQVTIPNEIRERFGIGPDTEVEFSVKHGEIVVRRVSTPLPLRKWRGHCGYRFRELGFGSVDDFVGEARGR